MGLFLRSGYKNGLGEEMTAIQCRAMLLALSLSHYGKRLEHISASWKVISW